MVCVECVQRRRGLKQNERIEGQFKRPLRVIAFNTGEGWSRDVTCDVAEKLIDLNDAGTALGAAARDFVERVTGKSAKAIV